jgi:hypothetical protein
MMVTSAFVFFVSCLDACLDAVGVRPPLVLSERDNLKRWDDAAVPAPEEEA